MAHIDSLTASYVLTAGTDLEAISNPTLESVYLRLSTHRGSCFWDPDLGSRLHELSATKATAGITREAEDLVAEALAPMVTAGELLDLEIATQIVQRGRIEIVLRATDVARRPLLFTHFVRVG